MEQEWPSKVGDEHKMRVLVVRHETGRLRCVRLGTNIPMLMENNVWVFETTSGIKGQGQVGRKVHFQHSVHTTTFTKI